MGNSSPLHVDDILIRPAAPADADAIGAMWERLVEYHQSLDPGLPSAGKDGGAFYARRIIDRLQDTHTHTLVAVHDDALIGYTLGVIVDVAPEMFVQETGGFLADIYVEQPFRRLGVGRRLVEALAEWFESRGVEHMEWYVAARNNAGLNFWETLGGRQVMIRMRIEL